VAAVRHPARLSRCKVFVGVGNAPVNLFPITVVGRFGIGIAATPELFDKCVAFLIVRQLGPRKVMAGVGLSAILRIFVLVSYAVLVGTAVAVPAAAALLSMATFFFITSLMEPLFLRL